MSDSPFVRAPMDPKEQPILDKLLSIRTELELLRQDKTTYLKSDVILELYEKVIEQVKALNVERTEKRLEQNRVDTVLDDCFQLISLSLLAVGKNHDPPAVYAAVSTMQRLLDHLKECAFFCPEDLDGISARIDEYRQSCVKGEEEYSAELITLLEARIDLCAQKLAELRQILSRLTPELSPTYSKLVSILRSLSACNARSKFPRSEVQELVGQLKDIERKLGYHEDISNKDKSYQQIYLEMLQHTQWMNDPSSEPASADVLVKELLYRCFIWSEIISEHEGRITEGFQDTFNKLLAIRNKLDNLLLTHSWSLRETDLYSYQRQLDRFDDSRVDGNFLDAEGNPADLHAQRTLLYLLRKSYALVYFLLISSEPVSEALLPIYNQLLTLRKCLTEVKKSGGVSSPRELYPYSMKLSSIDNMRVDGKFMVGDDIPDGQANVSLLLNECFELAYDLRNEAQANEEREREREQQGTIASAQEPTAVS